MTLRARCYACALALLPRDFRSRYADEMLETYSERVRERDGWRVTASEIGDVACTAVRLRAPQPAFAVMTGLAVTSFMLVLAQQQRAEQQIDFAATDPAGEFTLTIRNGKPVAASVNREAVSPDQLHQSGDSIRIVERGGKVIVAVAYYPETARIEWDARPETR